jgi:hypothetical protein
MKQLLLEYPEDEARLLVRSAFEQHRRIKKYKERKYHIAGNTGAGLASWGVKIIVNFPETDKIEKTPVTIESNRNVSINVTANKTKLEHEFMNHIDGLRGYSAEDIRKHKKDQEGKGGTKEISTNYSKETVNEQNNTRRGSINSYAIKFMFAFFIFIMLVMLFQLLT